MQLQFGVNHFGNAKKMSSFLPKIFVTCSQIFVVFSCLSKDSLVTVGFRTFRGGGLGFLNKILGFVGPNRHLES